MHISRVQEDIVRIGEGKGCNSSPTLHWRHSFYDLELRVSVVMLRKIKKESRAFVTESYINSRKFIQTCIMVSHGYANRHHIAQCGSDLAIHAKEVVPCIRASWHVIIISDVSSHKKDVWIKSGDNFTQVDCRMSIAWIASIDHPDGYCWIRWEGFIYSVCPILPLVEDFGQILCIWFQSKYQSGMHISGSFPLQSLIMNRFGCNISELGRVYAIQLPVRNDNFFNLIMSMDV